MNFISRLASWYFTRSALPLLIDYLIIIFCGYLAFYLFCGGAEVTSHFWPILWSLIALLVPYTIAFRVFHTYSGIFRYSSFVDLGRVALAMLLGTAIAVICYIPFHHFFPEWKHEFLQYPYRLAVFLLFATSFMCAARVVVKTVYDLFRVDNYSKRIFIYGAHDGGISLAKSIRNETPNRYTIKGFISSDASLQGKWLLGLPVYGEKENITELMRKQNVSTLMVSPLQTAHFREQEELVNSLISAGIKIMMLPSSAKEWDGKSELRYNQLHEVDIEDLLPRDKIVVDMQAIGRQLNESRILITGAAGSIGNEIVNQVARFEPKELILIDQAETPMHDVRRMMANDFPNLSCQTIVASITNQTFMENVFRRFRPDYVFHAAAYKHVPMMEDNPAIAVQNNIYGTRVIADLAVKYGTKKFVMISTDKAVNPTNVMGCSKRICEIYCQALNKFVEEKKKAGSEDSPCTQFVTTRFGNVLGSNGSVIPIFKEQIAKGGPVTVTHPDIIRYFMLIPEACKLVLEAGTMGKGGEIFVFDMGKPVRIADLAQRMITLSGAKNCQIQYTGLRDGEKLYEEVLNDAEHTLPTVHPKIMVAKVREYDYEKACQDEERLLEASYTGDDMAIVKIMKEIVPEFKSRHSKYEALD